MPALILPIIFVVIFYVAIIRPQQQRQREHRAMLDGLAPGDRVEGFSGIHGTLVDVADATVLVEIADGVVVTMAKLAVAGTIDVEDPMVPAAEPATGQQPDEEGAP